MPHLGKPRNPKKKRGRLRKNPPFPAPTLHNLDTLPEPLGERGGVIDHGEQASQAPVVD